VVEGHSYILGIDTSEGVGNDSTGMVVLDTNTMDVVAVFEDRTVRPDQVAEMAIKISNVYNGAYIIPERNGSGLTTVLKLQELGYNNVYRDTTIDKISNKVRDQMGWRTTSTSRDLMIDDFKELFEEGEIGLNDSGIVGQMMTFVRKENGKREHEDGKHDDLLFALMLCVQGLKYYRGKTAFLDYYNSEYGNTGQINTSFLETLKQGNLQGIEPT
jgi:hypothetical protein